MADVVVSRRAGTDGVDGTDDDEPYRTAAEIWRMPEVASLRASVPALRQIGVRSTFLSVEVTGAVREGKTVHRINAVISRGARDPKIVYWLEG